MIPALAVNLSLAVVLSIGLPWSGSSGRWNPWSRVGAGLLFLIIAGGLSVHNPGHWAESVVLVTWMAAALVDWREQIIPHRLVLLSVAAGALWTESSHGALMAHVVSGLAMGTMLLLIHWLSDSALGMGDVKFSGTLGVALGWMKGLVVLSLGFWMTGLFALGLVVFRRRKVASGIAFAPFLVLSALGVLWMHPSPMVLHW